LQDDNKLIVGAPEERRRFFDVTCSMESHQYYSTLIKFKRILKQRNQQIKNDIKTNTFNRSIWNEEFAKAAIFLIESRKKIINKLVKLTNEKLNKIEINKFDIEIKYESFKIMSEKDKIFSFIKLLEQNFTKENIFKNTLIGPHRDKITFLNKNRDMKIFSSQGEIRVVVMALKLSIIQYLGEEYSLYPVILFDDILTDIDEINMDGILSNLNFKNQVFFTATAIPKINFFKNLPENYFLEILEDKNEI